MRIFTLLAVLFLSLQALAQGQPGYYITSEGQRAEGFFKTSNFYDAATLEFRKAEDSDFTKLDTGNVQEYGINEQFRFRKFTIDNSSLFVNTVIDGNASLYSSLVEKEIVYYYTVTGKQDLPIKLEVVPARGREARKAENNQFREQLKKDVSCQDSKVNYDRLQYKESALAEVFTLYNQCTGATQITYKNSSAKMTPVCFTLFAGLHNMNYNIDNMSTPYEDSNTLSAGLGIEGAYRFGKGNFEIFAKLEFEHFSTTIKKNFPQPTGYITNYFDINTTVFDLFAGPRYNFIINTNNKIFVDAAFGLSVPVGDMSESSELTNGPSITLISREKHELDTAVCGNFGIGYTYKNKYGFALRYETNREFFNNSNTGYTGQFNRIGINVRYTFN